LENFDLNFEPPICDEIIITTNHECKIDGFTKVKIFPLDFEEYISFDNRELNIEATFNSYATNGTYPAMYAKHKDDFAKLYQNYLHTIYNTNKLQITTLQILSAHQGRVISVFELFNQLKKTHKISKDKFYELIKKFQEEYVLFFIEKFGSVKATKKLFMIDFTIRSALNFDKDFIKRFENIVFLELLKREKNIFYTDAIDFYLPDEKKAILTIPFLPINLIKNKIQRLDDHFEKFEVKDIQIVTMGEIGEFSQNGITCELLPFWSFATLL
jgi:predicted AAA+ superfamily ATPase